MSGHAAPVPRGGFAASRTVITAYCQQPIFIGAVLFFEDVSGNRQIAVRVKQFARLAVAVLLIAQIDLCQPHINPCGGCGAYRLLQRRAGVKAGIKTQ